MLSDAAEPGVRSLLIKDSAGATIVALDIAVRLRPNVPTGMPGSADVRQQRLHWLQSTLRRRPALRGNHMPADTAAASARVPTGMPAAESLQRLRPMRISAIETHALKTILDR